MTKLRTLVTIMLALVMASTLSVAQATTLPVNGWGLDLSSIGGGTYLNVDRLTVGGVATVMQDLPIAVGSAFTESGSLGVIQGYVEPGTFGTQFTLDTGGYNLYFQANGLAGTITDVTAIGYTYTFTPGVGSISLVADTNFDFGDGVYETLATFGVLAPSAGTNVGFLGGLGPNGTTSLTGEFLSANAGIFTYNGLDFGSLPAGYVAFGLMNTNNTIVELDTSGNPIIAQINSDGQFGVSVVPEPSTFLLLGAGLLGLGFTIRRKK